jgi:hypothetical protein
MNDAILLFIVFMEWKEKIRIRFKPSITGLSKDMEDFMLEQYDYYIDPPHKYGCGNCTFFQSFYKTCVDMWSKGRDLSEKQLAIIEREYNKVKKQRIEEFLKELKDNYTIENTQL